MSHIFAFHNMREEEDFFISDFYKDRQIERIEDPEGGNTKKLPTSIPSPFAIIDLTASAFAKLARTDTLKGSQLYEKLVSQCLDVGMVFFNAKSLQEKLEIVHWKREEELRRLLDSPEEGHQILGQTLRMYLKDDAETYNFNEYNSVFLLKYNYNFIGGTSSKTLFYCSLNPLEEDSDNYINLGGDDILFDDTYCPLYERPDDFQLYLYALVQNVNGAASKCQEIYDYMEKSKMILRTKNRELYEQIEALKPSDYQSRYSNLTAGQSGLYVSVLGLPIASKEITRDGVSDFKIKSDKFYGEKVPMALFPGFGGQNLYGETMTYFDGLYTNEVDEAIPYFNRDQEIDSRSLPGTTGIIYPHLLVDDLLEDVLYKVPFKIDNTAFFDCNYHAEGDGYLCPIKKEFFKYFDTEDLINGKTEDGRPIFELEKRSGDSIKATLRIPVNRGYITMERQYVKGQIDPVKNVGKIVLISLDVNIFPFIQVQEEIDVEYRTHFIYDDVDEVPKTTFCREDNTEIEVVESVKKGDISNLEFKTFGIDRFFKYIRLAFNGKEGILIPIWPKKEAASGTFHFAIDFGTTNSHIEYRVNGQESFPFDLNGVLGRFSGNRNLITEANKEFLPEHIKTQTEFSFPQRSIIASTKSLTSMRPVLALGDVRIPFYYETKEHTKRSDYKANLKWVNYLNSPEEEKMVAAFLEQLVLMMKAKVLKEGQLHRTRFTWFYPASMHKRRVIKLEELWLKLIKKHFKVDEGHVKRVTESIAPFAYYMKRKGLDSLTRPAVTIDIGGGTSDLVIFKNDLPVKLASFRFAANTIFGDGYNSNPNQNGFIVRYKDKLKEVFEANELIDVRNALASITSKSYNSADVVAFFMSLEQNVDVQKKTELSFQNLLADDEDLIIVLLLFYHSLMYYVAKLVKNSEGQMPGAILFSGNGGKLIKLLDRSSGFEQLSEYTTLIFNQIFSYPENERFRVKIILSDHPKEVTCKGGLYIDDSFNVEPKNIDGVFVGSIKEPDELPIYPELTGDNAILEEVIKEAQNSIRNFFEVNKQLDYLQNFGVSALALNLAKSMLSEDELIRRQMLQGLKYKRQELGENDDSKIEETPFFYPFVGVLNELAFKVVTNSGD